MKNVLVVSTTASMLAQFIIDDMKIYQELKCNVIVAANFKKGNNFTIKQIDEFKDFLEKMNITYYNIDFSRKIFYFSNLKAFFKLKKLLKMEKINIVHTHSPIASFITRLSLILNKHIISVYTVHGFHFQKGIVKISSMVYKFIEILLARVTDYMITINEEDYQKAKSFKAKKIYKLPGYGFDPKFLNSKRVERKIKLKELNIESDRIIVMSVGELTKRKNHRFAIKAISKSINNTKITYLVCGIGPKRSSLMKLARKKSVDLKLLGYRTDISELLDISDYFIFPSLQEGLPVSLMEAMTKSIIILCSNIRGNNDLISDEINGFLFNLPDQNRVTDIFNNHEINITKKSVFTNYNIERIKQLSTSSLYVLKTEIIKEIVTTNL
jgi:glycosyltransferase involved in cell wall biosynthesis